MTDLWVIHYVDSRNGLLGTVCGLSIVGYKHSFTYDPQIVTCAGCAPTLDIEHQERILGIPCAHCGEWYQDRETLDLHRWSHERD